MRVNPVIKNIAVKIAVMMTRKRKGHIDLLWKKEKKVPPEELMRLHLQFERPPSPPRKRDVKQKKKLGRTNRRIS